MANVNNPLPTNDDGFISVYNGAGYVAIYTVQYDLDGVHHFYQTPRFTLFFTEKVTIPDRATNIHLRVWYYLDIRTWVPFFDADFDSPPSICYKLYGTIYNPGCGEIPCDSLSTTPPNEITTPPLTHTPDFIKCAYHKYPKYDHGYYEGRDDGENFNFHKKEYYHCHCGHSHYCCKKKKQCLKLPKSYCKSKQCNK